MSARPSGCSTRRAHSLWSLWASSYRSIRRRRTGSVSPSTRSVRTRRVQRSAGLQGGCGRVDHHSSESVEEAPHAESFIRIAHGRRGGGVRSVLAGCSATSDPSTDSTAAHQPADLPVGDDPVQLDPAEFTTDIDNPYWPMEPGTRWTYREVDATGDELKVTVVVTSATRVMANGITARVVRDTVLRGEEIIEDTSIGTPRMPKAPSGTSVKTPPSSRTARSPRAPDHSKPGWTAPTGHRDTRGSRAGNAIPPGILRGRSGRQRRGLQHRGDGRHSSRPLHRRAPDLGHHLART